METVRFGSNMVEMTLRGTSMLVIHNFSEKAKQEIRDKQKKAPKRAKESRDVNAEFLANRYVDEQDHSDQKVLGERWHCYGQPDESWYSPSAFRRQRRQPRFDARADRNTRWATCGRYHA
jgi:hypothetical protein